MGWETDSSTGIRYYRQDTTLGCPYACVAMALRILKDKEVDESDLRSRASKISLMWDPDPNKQTDGANLAYVQGLLSQFAVESEQQTLDEKGLKDAQAEGAQGYPLILGVRWNTNGKHLVVCTGKDSTSKQVRILDPGVGPILISAGLLYQPTNSAHGSFDGKVLGGMCVV